MWLPNVVCKDNISALPTAPSPKETPRSTWPFWAPWVCSTSNDPSRAEGELRICLPANFSQCFTTISAKFIHFASGEAAGKGSASDHAKLAHQTSSSIPLHRIFFRTPENLLFSKEKTIRNRHQKYFNLQTRKLNWDCYFKIPFPQLCVHLEVSSSLGFLAFFPLFFFPLGDFQCYFLGSWVLYRVFKSR